MCSDGSQDNLSILISTAGRIQKFQKILLTPLSVQALNMAELVFSETSVHFNRMNGVKFQKAVSFIIVYVS